MNLYTALSIIATFFLVGCGTFSDPSFNFHASRVKADCRGDEICGLWFRQDKYSKEVYQFRPGGSGFIVDKPTDFLLEVVNWESEVISKNSSKREIKWIYEGNGVWKVWDRVADMGEPVSVGWTGDSLTFVYRTSAPFDIVLSSYLCRNVLTRLDQTKL